MKQGNNYYVKLYNDFVSRVDVESFLNYYRCHTAKDTAEHFECTVENVRKYAKSVGYKKTAKDSAISCGRFVVDDFINGIDINELVDYFSDHSLSETASKYSISDGKMWKVIDTLGIKRTEEQQKDFIKKSFSSVDWDERNRKSVETIESRYGSLNNYYSCIVDKCKETNKLRYGVDSVFKLDSTKDKIKNTKVSKYGEDYGKKAFENSIKTITDTCNVTIDEYYRLRAKKSAETKFSRYGDSTYNNRDKYRGTCLDRYGVDWYCQHPDCKSKSSNDSTPNKMFAKLLSDNMIEFEREFPLCGKSYDFKVGNYLIEVNPSITHNSSWNSFDKNKEPLDKNYHVNKSTIAVDNGYSCVHLWDWDDPNKVVEIVSPNKQIAYARKCELKSVDRNVANDFLEHNHLQGTCRGQTILLGLFLDGELIQLMTFGIPRYNSNYDFELLRLCTKHGYLVVGGAERLFKKFTDDHKAKTIISYCDHSKFNGHVYSDLGFTLIGSGKPSKHWYRLKDGKHITDNLLRSRGFDQLLGKELGYHGVGTSNEDLMLSNGFVEVYDAGQYTFIYR